jgi:urease accessory protein
MRRAALAAAILPFAPDAARAHVVIEGVSGFSGGLLHPLLVPAHALTLIALGLLTSTFEARPRIVLLAIFAAAALAAFGLIAMAYSATQAETLILCLGAAIGLLLAANAMPPFPVAPLLTMVIAVAIVFDSVPPVLTVRETVLALTGTTVAGIALVAATAWLADALPARIRVLARRIAGSWIAASAVMVLALRFAA